MHNRDITETSSTRFLFSNPSVTGRSNIIRPIICCWSFQLRSKSYLSVQFTIPNDMWIFKFRIILSENITIEIVIMLLVNRTKQRYETATFPIPIDFIIKIGKHSPCFRSFFSPFKLGITRLILTGVGPFSSS